MKKQNGITLIALVISIIVMLILAGISINAVVGDNGILTKTQETVFLQSCAVLEEYLQMEASNYVLEENQYGTQYGMLRAKHPGWFYQNAQGYILDSDGHVLYLIKKSGLPEEIQNQIKGGDATKVSQYYKQQDVYGVTSDLQVYYCSNGTDTILGVTVDDLAKDNPLEIAYDEENLLSKVVNGTKEDGKANAALSVQDLKSIKKLTIDSTEKLTLLNEFVKLPNLEIVHFKGLTIANLEGIQNAISIKELRFINCTVNNYSALCGLTNLNKLYLITPTGKNTDVSTLCSMDKGIASAEFSNLRYFGIVGNGYYLESKTKYTENTQTSSKCEITDISGLSNLNLVTKQAIQYMYLQNLQITSIASLIDYINIVEMRVDLNPLITLDGIQNMSKLSYLMACNCYSNANSTYTLGSNETDIQNTSTDALSYIYKDESGKNNSLYFLDMRNADKLKWTSYLSTCTALKYLYMDGNNAIKDISTIASILGQCGVNYEIPSTFTTSIIANNSKKLDLNGQKITESQFRILKNNTNLTHLNLSNTVITDGSGATFSDADYTALLNEVLSSCVNIEYLILLGQNKLQNIDFVENMNSLKELDLYNCSQVNDISILETKTNAGVALKLGLLNINNVNIDLTTIQNTISNLGSYSTYWYPSNGGATGLHIGNITLAQTLSNCTEITKLVINRGNGSPKWFTNIKGTVDLSGCNKLKYIYVLKTAINFKLPSSTKEFYLVNGAVACDLSNCNQLTKLQMGLGTMNYDVITSTVSTLPENFSSLESLYFGSQMGTYPDLNFLAKFQNCINLKDISIVEQNNNLVFEIQSWAGFEYISQVRNITISFAVNGVNTFENLPDLTGFTNLETFSVEYGNIQSISNIANCTSLKTLKIKGQPIRNVDALANLINLTSLDLNNNQIANISGLGSLINLTYLDLNNNGITDIKPLSNLNKLETLYIQNNALYDNFYDSTGNAHYTLTVFSDLNQKQDGSLKKLYLSGNKIDDFSMLQDSNLKWDGKSGW